MSQSSIRWIRATLWILAAIYLVNGVAMFLFPSAWFFRLVPGVPETGPYNMHLVMDSGTFFLGVGVGLIASAIAPQRNAIAVLIAAVASTAHSALHLWSHAEGFLSWHAATTEIFGIYIPTLALLAIAIALYGPDAPADARAARAA
ncbi:MAG: hypothetical protein ACYDC3_11190 [Candidatus Binataceae bacterium]